MIVAAARLTRAAALATLLATGGCADATHDADADARRTVLVPPGSVPRGSAEALASARAPGPQVTPALLAAGERGYLGKCAPCHGRSLEGDGPVVRLGYPRPPPLTSRERDAVHVVDVIARGHGEMPAMAAQVSPPERWAIARWLERR